MTFCEKCGGQISEDMKFCDKCGSPVSHEPIPAYTKSQEQVYNSESASEQTITQEEQNLEQPQEHVPVSGYDTSDEKYNTPESHSAPFGKTVPDIKGVVDNVISALPPAVTQPGSKTMFFAGLGSTLVLALIYIVCFFSFMADISFVVGCSALPDVSLNLFGTASGDIGASSIWMIVYFILNLFPLGIALHTFFKPASKNIAFVASASIMLMTLFALIAWGICEADNFWMAGSIYPASNSWGTFAWYCLVDCLSEAWYLKLPFALASVFCFGVDHLINSKK